MRVMWWSQLRRRWGRSLALLTGLTVAVSAFVVLTSNVESSRLEMVGTAEDARGAYDILVRPQGIRSTLEAEHDLINSHTAAGQEGGISTQQWRDIAQINGVEVAAPFAMLGMASTFTHAQMDVSDAVDTDALPQLLRLEWNTTADNGLSQTRLTGDGFVYITEADLVWPKRDPIGFPLVTTDGSGWAYEDGRSRPDGACNDPSFDAPVYEISADGTEKPLCVLSSFSTGSGPDLAQHRVQLAQLLPDGGYIVDGEEREALEVTAAWPITVPMAAIDPESEAALLGLDRAIIDGDYLSADDEFTFTDLPTEVEQPNGAEPVDMFGEDGILDIPVIMADDPPVDESVITTAAALSDDAAGSLAGVTDLSNETAIELMDELLAEPAADVLKTPPVSAEQWYGSAVPEMTVNLSFAKNGTTEYTVDEQGRLHPETWESAAENWPGWTTDYYVPTMAPFTADAAFRPVVSFMSVAATRTTTKGVFDRGELSPWPDEARLPLDSYDPVALPGADDRSRELLNGEPLLPNGNPAGYAVGSPAVLMSLDSWESLLTERRPEAWDMWGAPTLANDPVSAVRVRVAGVTGADEVSRERVRVVAERIAERTGLTVDIVLGASPVSQQVVLPGGDLGRPDLVVTELWTKKGVATHIVSTIETTSLILFGLVLTVCGLFIANAVAAAARTRRTEIGVLRCLGWRRRHVLTGILTELSVLGALAGVVGVGVSWLAGRLLDITMAWTTALWSVPIAVGLVLVAGGVPAWRATRVTPMAAVRPAAAAGRRARLRWGIPGLAAANLWRAKGRTVIGVAALAVAVAAATVLLAVQFGFQGAIVGSVLGEAVSVQARAADFAAVIVMMALSVIAVADVMYLNIRDRASEFAALSATGWPDRSLRRLVLTEAGLLGCIGGLAGSVAGVAAAAWLAADGEASLLAIAATTMVCGIGLCVAAGSIPVMLLKRRRLAGLLAEE